MTLVVFVASLTIEATQYLVATGRVASSSDLTLNTLGGYLGALVGVHVLRPPIRGWVARERQPVVIHQE